MIEVRIPYGTALRAVTALQLRAQMVRIEADRALASKTIGTSEAADLRRFATELDNDRAAIQRAITGTHGVAA